MNTFEKVFKRWQKNIDELGGILSLDSNSIEILKTDRGLERYVHISLEKGVPSLELLVTLAAEGMIYKLDKGLDKVDFLIFCKQLRSRLIEILSEIDEKYSKVFENEEINYNTITNLISIGKILKSRKSIHESYFNSYNCDSKNQYLIRIYDGRDFDIIVNIGNPDMITQLGFYRIGFNYRTVENDKSYLVNSVTRTLGKNEEIGHYNMKGYYDNIDEGYIGIYCR